MPQVTLTEEEVSRQEEVRELGARHHSFQRAQPMGEDMMMKDGGKASTETEGLPTVDRRRSRPQRRPRTVSISSEISKHHKKNQKDKKDSKSNINKEKKEATFAVYIGTVGEVTGDSCDLSEVKKVRLLPSLVDERGHVCGAEFCSLGEDSDADENIAANIEHSCASLEEAAPAVLTAKKWGELQISDVVMIKGHPCKVINITAAKKGNNGLGKLKIEGSDIRASLQCEDVKQQRACVEHSALDSEMLMAQLGERAAQLQKHGLLGDGAFETVRSFAKQAVKKEDESEAQPGGFLVDPQPQAVKQVSKMEDQ
ncbi:unnamed protein product, partial [Prorocentrum cordatum]